jgi:hypothetical protein
VTRTGNSGSHEQTRAREAGGALPNDLLIETWRGSTSVAPFFAPRHRPPPAAAPEGNTEERRSTTKSIGARKRPSNSRPMRDEQQTKYSRYEPDWFTGASFARTPLTRARQRSPHSGAIPCRSNEIRPIRLFPKTPGCPKLFLIPLNCRHGSPTCTEVRPLFAPCSPRSRCFQRLRSPAPSHRLTKPPSPSSATRAEKMAKRR